MPANARDIKRRIKSVKNTAQITNAMQLVAASKMKRAQDSALAGRPYAELLAGILDHVGSQLDLLDLSHPLLTGREVKTRGVLVISPDRGLCGSLPSNLFRLVTTLPESTKYVAIGRKGSTFLSRTKRNLMADFQVHDKVPYAEVRAAIKFLVDAYVEGKVDTIEVCYTRFKNTLTQVPTLVQLAPIDDLAEMIKAFVAAHPGEDSVVDAKDAREMRFEPDMTSILQDLITLFVQREVYQLVLEAKASEHSARMVAMKTATDNAKELADELTLQYNKARQAAITQEILELAAGQQAG